MVALNFQTSDLSMQLNQGKFEYNGNCGYVALFPLCFSLLSHITQITDLSANCNVHAKNSVN